MKKNNETPMTNVPIFDRLGLLVSTLLVLTSGLRADETNTIQRTSRSATNEIVLQPRSDGIGQSEAVQSSVVPRLQKRQGPDLPPQHILSPVEEERLRGRHAPWRGTPPNRFAFGPTNSESATSAPAFTHRPMHPGDPLQLRAGQSQITSRRAPPSVLKQYDHDKNGLLDPAEWYLYRQDIEKRLEQSKIRTNASPSVISTNKPVAP